MLVKLYSTIFIICSLLLTYEWLLLNEYIQGVDLLALIPALKGFNRSTEPGRPLSLILGYTGFGLMCMTNPYLIRKRISFMRKWGNLKGWLDFHILCGALGPIFIIFHTNFKIGGLVAISFWSMIISATSGVVGKYFYTKVLKNRANLMQNSEMMETKIKATFEKKDKLDAYTKILDKFHKLIKLPNNPEDQHDISITKAIYSSLMGDFNLLFRSHRLKKKLSRSLYVNFRNYILLQRQIYFLSANKKFMGHWHTFHKPFAIFMYVVAIIHIAVALLFQVKHITS